MRELLHYLKPYWKQAIIAPLLMVLEVVMDLLQPRMMQRIIDQGIRLGDQQLVIETGLLMIVFALLGAELRGRVDGRPPGLQSEVP